MRDGEYVCCKTLGNVPRCMIACAVDDAIDKPQSGLLVYQLKQRTSTKCFRSDAGMHRFEQQPVTCVSIET